jgi:hypothetical protein
MIDVAHVGSSGASAESPHVAAAIAFLPSMTQPGRADPWQGNLSAATPAVRRVERGGVQCGQFVVAEHGHESPRAGQWRAALQTLAPLGGRGNAVPGSSGHQHLLRASTFVVPRARCDRSSSSTPVVVPEHGKQRPGRR